jgi:hypothetical protein
MRGVFDGVLQVEGLVERRLVSALKSCEILEPAIKISLEYNCSIRSLRTRRSLIVNSRLCNAISFGNRRVDREIDLGGSVRPVKIIAGLVI